MNQDNGGIIGKINTPTQTVASGVWSIEQQFEAQSSSIWPLAFPRTTFTNACRFNSDAYMVKNNESPTNQKKIHYKCLGKKISAVIKTKSIHCY